MSTTLAFRLILGLLVGGVLTFSVWDRNDRELKEQPADEDTRTGMPRFRSFAAVETLPTMLVMYLAISLAIGGRELAMQYLLGLLLRVFLLIGVYYVLLLAVLPLLRRHISARVCAVLWLLPGYLYFLAQVSSVQRADPGGERMLVLHASGTLVTVLLAVWACRYQLQFRSCVSALTDATRHARSTGDFTVTVDGAAAVSAPGRAAGSTYIIEADSQLHTIVATDRAGNSTQVQITVNNGHTVGTPASCKAPAVCRYCGESFGDPAPGNHGGLLRRVEKVNATSTADGNIEYWYCSGCGKYYLDAAAGREITRGDTILPAIGLRIVGDVRVWRPGDKPLGVTFHQKYGDFTVQIDGVTVDPANYEVTADPDSGRLIVTFRAQFLRTLAFGERTITIVSGDGSASVSFRRDSARAVTSGGKDGGKAGVTSAATGDGFPMGGMAAALLVSGSALVMLSPRARRKEEE